MTGKTTEVSCASFLGAES